MAPEIAPTPLQAVESPEMTLLRPRPAQSDDVVEPGEFVTHDEAAHPAALAAEQPDANMSEPVETWRPPAPEPRVRMPRILRLWRRQEEPRRDLDLTLARPTPAAAPAPAQVRRSTYNVETGRLETAEALPATEALQAAREPPMAVAREAASVLRRSPRAAATATRPEQPLVYRARPAMEAAPAAGRTAVPGGMTTLAVSPAIVSRLSLPGGLTDQARAFAGAEVESRIGGAAGAAAGAAVSGEAPAAASAGPSAPPPGVESDAGKQLTLETLARQVYDRLRARLLVERERSGIGAGMMSR